MNDEERETIVSLNDFHVPFHDDKAIDVALKFVKYLHPYRIVLHELLDWYSLSRFDKDPNRKLDLNKDKKLTVEYLRRIRDMFPKTKIVMLQGNHDKRLIKYLRIHAEELHNLDELKIQSLLKLDELDIEYRTDYSFRGVLFKHGEIVRKYSGYTARAELEKEGVSGCSGHTHRMGAHYQTLRGGKYVWLETGCLCDPKQADYIEGTANWQQGLGGMIFKKGSKHFYPFLTPVIDGEIIWGNKTFN